MYTLKAFFLLLYFRSFIFMAPMEQNSMEQIFLALGNPLARMKNGTTPPPLIIPIWMLRNWKNESSDLNQITLLDLIFPEPACSGKINFIFIILFVLGTIVMDNGKPESSTLKTCSISSYSLKFYFFFKGKTTLNFMEFI